ARFFVNNPREGFRIGTFHSGSTNITSNSIRFAANLGLQESPSHAGSEVNAFRHVQWQASITAAYGADAAKEAGDAHETNPAADLSKREFAGPAALAQADQTIDLLNNQIGRAIGDANPDATQLGTANAVLDYFHNQGLYTAVEHADGTVSIVKTKL